MCYKKYWKVFLKRSSCEKNAFIKTSSLFLCGSTTKKKCVSSLTDLGLGIAESWSGPPPPRSRRRTELWWSGELANYLKLRKKYVKNMLLYCKIYFKLYLCIMPLMSPTYLQYILKFIYNIIIDYYVYPLNEFESKRGMNEMSEANRLLLVCFKMYLKSSCIICSLVHMYIRQFY